MSLSDRTRAFALGVIRLADDFPNSRSSYTVARQLIGAGSSPGAHFREALRARSKSEYVAKLNGGVMELEETLYWLEIVDDLKFSPRARIEELRDEGSQLIAIMLSLINKWKPNR